MVALTLLVGLTVGLTHKQLLFITFDREAARLARINVWLYDTLLIVLTALVVVAAMQILGAILVAGMLVIPVAAAMQLSASFNRGMALSVVVGQIAIFGGIFLSYIWNIATGAMIILVAIGVYLWALVFVWNSRVGLLLGAAAVLIPSYLSSVVFGLLMTVALGAIALLVSARGSLS